MTAQLPKHLLDSLLVRFDARRLQTIAQIETLLAQPESGHLEVVTESAHKLAGIAATLGFPEIGSAAGEVDRNPIALPLDAKSRAGLETLRSSLVNAVRSPSPESDAQ